MQVLAQASSKEGTEAGPRPPGLEQSKAAVLSSLTSASGQRTYDHAILEFVALVLLGSRASRSTTRSCSATRLRREPSVVRDGLVGSAHRCTA